MSKDRDLILDMTEDPEVLTYPAADNEPLQLGGVGDDASAAADRQVTTPGDVHVAPQMPAPIDGTLRQFALRVPSVIDECSGIMVFGKRIKSLVFSTDLCIIRNVNADAVFAVYPFTPQPVLQAVFRRRPAEKPAGSGLELHPGDGQLRLPGQQQQAQQPRTGSQVAHGHPPPQPGKGPQQKRIRGGAEQSVGICERIPAGPKPVPMLHGAPLPGVFSYCNILFHRTQGHPGPRDCEPPRKMKVYRYFIRTGGCIFGFS